MKYRKSFDELPVLTEEQRDDASFRGFDQAWASLVRVFEERKEGEPISYEKLGRRIKRSRAQVQRWFSSPFGMNLRSLGLLAEGLDADLVIEVRPRLCTASLNACHPREAVKATFLSREMATSTSYAVPEFAFGMNSPRGSGGAVLIHLTERVREDA